jgi:hypothetical protein
MTDPFSPNIMGEPTADVFRITPSTFTETVENTT